MVRWTFRRRSARPNRPERLIRAPFYSGRRDLAFAAYRPAGACSCTGACNRLMLPHGLSAAYCVFQLLRDSVKIVYLVSLVGRLLSFVDDRRKASGLSSFFCTGASFWRRRCEDSMKAVPGSAVFLFLTRTRVIGTFPTLNNVRISQQLSTETTISHHGTTGYFIYRTMGRYAPGNARREGFRVGIRRP